MDRPPAPNIFQQCHAMEVKFDTHSRESLEDINSKISAAGNMQSIFSFYHIYSWANTSNGAVAIFQEDWCELAKALNGIQTVSLLYIMRKAQYNIDQYITGSNNNLAEFWQCYFKTANTIIKAPMQCGK